MQSKTKKSSEDSLNIKRKAQLLRQKILANAAITHNTYQYRITQLTRQYEQSRTKLNQLVGDLNRQLQRVSEKYQKDMKNLNDYYTSGKVAQQAFPGAIQAEQVKKYLNTEKAALKKILQLETDQSNGVRQDRLHRLVKQRQLQQLLRQVQVKQLEKQVKYLSTHVINSSGLIYVPESTMSEAEETELNTKIDILMGQLQRLIELEIVCGASDRNARENQVTNTDKILNGLAAQQKRLNIAFDLLTAEKQAIIAIEKQLSPYIDIGKQTPLYNITLVNQLPNAGLLQMLTVPQDEELERVINQLNLQQYTDIVGNRKCQIQELTIQLKLLKTRLIKIQ